MGQKVHPKAYRLSTTKESDAKWFARRDQVKHLLREDTRIREFVMGKLKDAMVDRVEFERTNRNVTVVIYSAKPGVVIGRSGAGIEELKKEIMRRFYAGRRVGLNITVNEVKQPSLSARVVGRQIATEIEKRMPFRRSMKQARERVMKAGAEGVRITVAGRLNGADIARSESVSQGKVPLHTLRADIDFAITEANTIYGVIGIKVWINRGEVFEETRNES